MKSIKLYWMVVKRYLVSLTIQMQQKPALLLTAKRSPLGLLVQYTFYFKGIMVAYPFFSNTNYFNISCSNFLFKFTKKSFFFRFPVIHAALGKLPIPFKLTATCQKSGIFVFFGKSPEHQHFIFCWMNYHRRHV